MNVRSEKAIKAFQQYQQTGNVTSVEYLTAADLHLILDDLSRFKDDWYYSMMMRRLAFLNVQKKTFKEKIKSWFK